MDLTRIAVNGMVSFGRVGQCVLALAVVTGFANAQVTGDTSRLRQDSVRREPVRAVPQQRRDSLRPPVSPGRAFLTSLAVPGLGQSRLGRQLPGAIYAGVEAMSFLLPRKGRAPRQSSERPMR